MSQESDGRAVRALDAQRLLIPRARAVRGLSDRGAVAVAVATALGAWWANPVPLWPGALLLGLALWQRRPTLLVIAGLLIGSTMGAKAMAGLSSVEEASHDGLVTLVADPVETRFGYRVDVRAGRYRYELRAHHGAAGAVSRALAGERLIVAGRIKPPPDDAPWLVPRHVRGVLDADRTEFHDHGAAPWRAANRFRALLDRGSQHLPEPTRSLYGGFVLGDARGQPVEVVDDFRASGLTHLLVVSGQNVAFVLVLVGPVIRRQRLVVRWLTTLGVIASFALLTRFEPSVLRASMMAAVAATAVLAGRTSGTLRTLAIAATVLLWIDPLLVRSVAFQLSVAASVGIALLGTRISRWLPGPRWWRDTLGVTLAAQLGVAPVIIPRFGGMPVVSILANLLAVPPSGLVTSWGLPAGVVAGTFGEPIATIAHLPTRLLVGWVAGVARVTSALPFGEAGAVEVVVAVAAAAGALGASRWHARLDTSGTDSVGLHALRALQACFIALMVAALLTPAVGLRSHPTHLEVIDGVHLHRAGGATVLVIEGDPSAARVLEALRVAGVRRLDLVITESGLGWEMGDALKHRWPLGRELVLAEESPTLVRVGGLVVEVTSAHDPVSVRQGP